MALDRIQKIIGQSVKEQLKSYDDCSIVILNIQILE